MFAQIISNGVFSCRHLMTLCNVLSPALITGLSASSSNRKVYPSTFCRKFKLTRHTQAQIGVSALASPTLANLLAALICFVRALSVPSSLRFSCAHEARENPSDPSRTPKILKSLFANCRRSSLMKGSAVIANGTMK